MSALKDEKYYIMKPSFNEQVFIPIEDIINIYYCDLENKIDDELSKSKLLLDIDDLKALQYH